PEPGDNGENPEPGASTSTEALPALAPEGSQDRAKLERMLLRFNPWTPVTTILMALNVVLFVGIALSYFRCLVLPSSALLNWGAGYGVKALGGEPWRALSAVFLHAGLAHLFVNMWFLLMAGGAVERLLGWRRFLVVYLFAGLQSVLLSMAWSPTTVVV